MEQQDWKVRIKKAEGNDLPIAFRPEISKAAPKVFKMPWRASSSAATIGIGDTGTTLLILISAIEGIDEIEIRKDKVTITKADLYEWNEIIPQVKDCIYSATNLAREQIEDLHSIVWRDVPTE